MLVAVRCILANFVQFFFHGTKCSFHIFRGLKIVITLRQKKDDFIKVKKEVGCCCVFQCTLIKRSQGWGCFCIVTTYNSFLVSLWAFVEKKNMAMSGYHVQFSPLWPWITCCFLSTSTSSYVACTNVCMSAVQQHFWHLLVWVCCVNLKESHVPISIFLFFATT